MSMKLKKIFYGAYGISRRGIIIRLAKNNGARVGYRLTPYTGTSNSEPRVKLQYGDRVLQITVKELIRRAWG